MLSSSHIEGPLVAVFAHPDDEVFVAGLLATAAKREKVYLICATRGEKGTARQGTPGDLGKVRARELLLASATLGLPAPMVLGFPDGELESADLEEELRDLFASLKPGTLVTFGPDGLYGHRDHIAVTNAVLAARGSARVVFPCFPDELVRPIHRALRKTRFVTDTWTPPTPPDGATFSLTLSSDIARQKRDAAACHRSQLEDGDPESFLRPGLLPTLLDAEHYRVA